MVQDHLKPESEQPLAVGPLAERCRVAPVPLGGGKRLTRRGPVQVRARVGEDGRELAHRLNRMLNTLTHCQLLPKLKQRPVHFYPNNTPYAFVGRRRDSEPTEPRKRVDNGPRPSRHPLQFSSPAPYSVHEGARAH